MLFITRSKLANWDKKITRLLRESKFYSENKNKDIYDLKISDVYLDEPWISGIKEFIDIVWREKAYQPFFLKYSLSKQDLIDFYILMTIATMPNPIFKTGRGKLTHTLVGSAMYQEVKKQLTTCMTSLGYFDNKQEQERYGHRYASDVMSFASALKFAHENAYGKITLEEALLF